MAPATNLGNAALFLVSSLLVRSGGRWQHRDNLESGSRNHGIVSQLGQPLPQGLQT